MREIHEQYNEPSVTVPLHEWRAIIADLEELDELRAWRKEQADRDWEYVNWSLSPQRMLDAMALGEKIYGSAR